MSIIGIDFGNESCYVAAAKLGGIETLANDYSLRATPSIVAFDGKKRIIGVAAKNKQVTNLNNTVSGFKRLLGRKFNDPHVQREIKSIPTRVESTPNGSIGYHVNYLDKEQTFTPEQLTAMLFTKLKDTSTAALGTAVNDCVICCPVYFTNAERKALLDAAQIAGLNVLRLLNETTATALSYGFYKNEFTDDKPRNVVFVDCGNASLQVSAVAFTNGKLKMLASAWEQIGGRDFDNLLAEHFNNEFIKRYNLDARKNPRAYLRLLTELEKLKKNMSANSTKLPLYIECFMEDTDVSSSMQRSEMEELCSHLFQRVEQTFERLLRDSKLHLEDIHSVEIVGGSSRIPAIKALIEKVFGKTASTTLNQDESVARGAALQCAIISPAMRVRDFGITDIQNYAVKVSWNAEGPLSAGEIEVFPAFHAAPFSRLLTLNRREPFQMKVEYAQPIPYPDPTIGQWFIMDVKPTDKGELQEVKVKVRINHHGIVLISSASLVDKKEDDAAEQQSAAAAEESAEQQQSNESNQAASETNEKKKKVVKLIELPMECVTCGNDVKLVKELAEQEQKMIANDQLETERVDARNALEEFIYDTRGKLVDGGSFEAYTTSATATAIVEELGNLEQWLYEDGDECDRDVYINKLNELKAKTDPIKNRSIEFESLPGAFDELANMINFAKSVISEFRNGAPKYDHLTETEFLKIQEHAEKSKKFLDNAKNTFQNTPRQEDLSVSKTEVRNEMQSLHSCITSVINRPKPKPASSTSGKSSTGSGTGKGSEGAHKDGGAAEQQNGEENGAGKNNGAKTSVPEDSTMDVE